MPQDDAVCHNDNDTDDEFGDDNVVCNDDDGDYADIVHPVQILKNHLRLIHGSVIMDYIQNRF